jgi:cyclic pyranopterin phosphate synthase
MSGNPLSHFDKDGRPHMVDVSEKPSTARKAIARGVVSMNPATLEVVLAGNAKKGDVRTIAELAGIMGAKHTSTLIPLCHPLPLSSVKLQIRTDTDLPGLIVEAAAKTTGQTGVEMEALTAVSVACLTIYDMLKAADKNMVIGDICLVEKTGGKSGDWRRQETSR